MIERGDAPGDRDHRIAAEREAGGADPPGVDSRHEGRVGEHAVDYRAQVARPLPPQRKTGNRIAVDRIVAGVVDGGGDIAGPGQRRPQPSEAPAGSAGAVRQHDQRKFRRRRREQRLARRTGRSRLLRRARIGRIPDCHGQRMLWVAAPLVGRRRREFARRDADVERGCGRRRGPPGAETDRGCNDARQQDRSDHRTRPRHYDAIRLINPRSGFDRRDARRRVR